MADDVANPPTGPVPADVGSREYYPNFDWLRVAFAVQVVAIHAGVAPHIVIQPVAAFLAVSGFVVLGSIQRLRARSFFINRALRVLPLLFATFLFVYIRYGFDELALTIQFWLWPFGPYKPVNEVVWTLMYEEFFYAVLVVLFGIGFYKNLISPVIVLVCMLAVLVTGAFFGIPSTFFFLGASFFLGNIAYLLRRQIARIPAWGAVAMFVVASVFMWRLPYVAIVMPSDALATYASIGAMLVFGIAGPRLPRLRVDISYSLYLVHSLVRQELFGVVPFGIQMFGAMLIVSFPICLLCWFLIERPALRFRRRGPDRVVRAPAVTARGSEGVVAMDSGARRVVAVVLAAIMGAIIGTGVGYFAYSTSSGAGGAGDLPLYMSTIWGARDGALWTGLGALIGAAWAILQWFRR